MKTLAGLPKGPLVVTDGLEICHGAPFDEDYYVFESIDAGKAMDAASERICLFGHTHLPVVFRRNPNVFDGFLPEGPNDTLVQIEGGLNYLINVGSVGQPRDGDPRAAFGIYDSAAPSVLIRRIQYPVEIAQRRILDAGLPASLANRLGIGR